MTTSGHQSQTPMHMASSKGKLSCVRFLREVGADIDAIDASGRTPLICSVECGDQMDGHACVQFLLSVGAGVHARDSFHRTALHHASRLGNVDVTRLLLSKGARLDDGDTEHGTPRQTTSAFVRYP